MGPSQRFVAAIAVLFWPVVAGAATLTAEQAQQHVGQTATVCGTVASAHYAARSRGQPTFLNLDKPYPAQIFTAVIWGENRAAFGMPERALLDRRVCVTGKIRTYRGRPEMFLRKPEQLSEQ